MKRFNIDITEDQAIMLLELLNRKIDELDKIDFDSGELIIDQVQRMFEFICLHTTISACICGESICESDICAD